MVEAAREFVNSFLSQRKCADCGEDDIEILTFDHVTGEKKGNISNLVSGGYSIETIRKEISVCEVVCFNCHMRREQRRRGTTRFGHLKG